jgi:hypothetical protein
MSETACRAWPARCGARAAGVAALSLLALLAPGYSGCGKSTPPEPVSRAAPAPENVKAFQQGDEILVAWSLPSATRAGELGGLVGFVLLIEDLRYDCLGCEPLQMREMVLDRTGERIDLEGNRAFHVEKPVETRRVWRVRVAYRFGAGRSLPSHPQLVRGLVPIPKPAFRAEPAARLTAPADAPGVGAEVNLVWEPELERIALVQVTGSPPTERALNYGMNVYRRVQGKPWPRFPLNHEPLPGPAWLDRIPRETVNQTGGRLEYAVRWVSQSGAEGPLSDPVMVDLPVGAR